VENTGIDFLAPQSIIKQIYDKRVIRELYLPFGSAELQTDSLKDELTRLTEYWNAAIEVKDSHESGSGRET
jgi:hypothetical protein